MILRLIKYSFVGILLFTFFSCKKYPESGFTRQGPKTFTTDKNGVWKLNLFEVDGIDSTNLLPNTSQINDYYNYFLACSFYNCGSKQKCMQANAGLFEYQVKFMDSNKKISFENHSGLFYCFNYMGNNVCLRNILCPETDNVTVWTVRKLREKECVLETSMNHSYKLILKR